jgi:Uncharacterized protein involved in copper resistance
MALLEVCCGNPESVDAAVAGGARRIELCADLECDGLTPPMAWLRAVREKYPELTVHVLIRPREGDFVYSPEEADIMALQIESALQFGADGIVVGCLTPDGDIDLPLMEQLVGLVESFNLATELGASDLCHAANDSHFFPGPARRVSITFHRAFDRCRRPFEAMEQIIGLGCDRILTSGQAPTVEEGAERLRDLRQRAHGRIGILPGGGVTPSNAARILDLTGCTEIHASASETVDGKKMTSTEKVKAILQSVRNR